MKTSRLGLWARRNFKEFFNLFPAPLNQNEGDRLVFQEQDQWQQVHIFDYFDQYDTKMDDFVSSSIQCQICQECLPSQEFLQDHCDTRHQCFVLMEDIESLIQRTKENVEEVIPIKSRTWKRNIPHEILFTCELCNTGFAKESFYLVHKEKCIEEQVFFTQSRKRKRRNLPAKPYTCEKCNTAFVKESFYLLHMKRFMCKHYIRCEGSECLPLHMRNPKTNQHYKCRDCLKCWGNRPELLNHHKRDHEEKGPKYKCQNCNLEYFKESSLKWHRQKLPCRYYNLCEDRKCLPVKNKRHYKCKECGKCFIRGKQAVRHYLVDHEKKPLEKCDICGIETFFMIAHRKAHPEVPLYKCDKCSEPFSRNTLYWNHMYEVHGEKMFVCEQCGKSFGHRCRLKSHMKEMHGQENSHVCHECGKFYSVKSSLEKHIKNVHTQREIHQCDQCQKTFLSKGGLEKHIKVMHEGIRDDIEQCPHCGKTVTNKMMKYHLLTKHTNEKNVFCNQCDYRTQTNHSLKKHVFEVHIKQGKFECNQCDHVLKTKNGLRQHIRSVHEGIRYDCHLCDKKYTASTDLKRHVQQVHEKKQYNCRICNSIQASDFSLYRHVQKEHGISVKEMNRELNLVPTDQLNLQSYSDTTLL